MKSVKSASQLLAGVVLVFATGCYAWYPYGYGYQGYYGAPPAGTPLPQGAYLAPPDFSANGGQPAAPPPKTFSEPQEDWKQHSPDGEGKIEAFRPESSGNLNNNQSVPQPRDVGEAAGPAGASSFPMRAEPGDQFPLRVPDPSPIELEGIDDLNAAREPSNMSDFQAGPTLALGEPDTGGVQRVSAQTDLFLAPIPVKSVSSTRSLNENTQSVPNEVSPFDYDRKNYSWLRGVVDFDEQNKTWHLMYSQMPEPKDVYGGDIALIDHPDLAHLRDSDVVLVEGAIDANVPDRLGKASYRIKKLVGPLVPQK